MVTSEQCMLITLPLPHLSQVDMDRDPIPKVNLTTGAPHLPGEVLRRRHPPTRRSSPGSTPTSGSPRSPQSVSQPEEGFREADPYSMSRESPAPPHTRETASRQRVGSDTPRASPPRAPRETPYESEEHHRASRNGGDYRAPPSDRRTSRAPFTRPTTTPWARNYDLNRNWREQ